MRAGGSLLMYYTLLSCWWTTRTKPINRLRLYVMAEALLLNELTLTFNPLLEFIAPSSLCYISQFF